MMRTSESTTICNTDEGAKLWLDVGVVSVDQVLDQVRRDNFALNQLRLALEDDGDASTDTSL